MTTILNRSFPAQSPAPAVPATAEDVATVRAFLREHSLAVEASVTPDGRAQAALVGFVANDALELVFDTIASSRKAANLRENAKVAFVIGGWTPGDERTLQWEGVADELSGSELDARKALYFARFPDGPARESWPGIVYLRCRPSWIRFSDFNCTPPRIVELDERALRELDRTAR